MGIFPFHSANSSTIPKNLIPKYPHHSDTATRANMLDKQGLLLLTSTNSDLNSIIKIKDTRLGKALQSLKRQRKTEKEQWDQPTNI
jgi:hypothetical protein